MLSDNIRNYRKKNSMSQDDLAEKLGVSRQSVSLWETGQSQPTIENILALANIFGISTDTLLRDENHLPDAIENQPKKTPRQKNKVAIILACIATVVLVVGVVVLLAFYGRDPNTDLPDNGDMTDNSSVSTTVSADNDLLTEESDLIDSESVAPTEELDLFAYCRDFAIKIGNLNGDYSIYQQPAVQYGGYDGEYFSISYWADSDMVEFCLHCPLSDTQSINFYLRMRGGYDHQYEYLSSRYYRDSGASIRCLSGHIDPAVFSESYPLSWETYEGDGGVDKQTDFIEESRVGICDLIHCLKEFVKVENMECSFSDFEFVCFQ